MSNNVLTDDVACFLPLGGLGITVSHSGPFVSSSLGNPNLSSEMSITCKVIATRLVRTDVEVDQVEPMVRDKIEQMLAGLLAFLEWGSSHRNSSSP